MGKVSIPPSPIIHKVDGDMSPTLTEYLIIAARIAVLALLGVLAFTLVRRGLRFLHTRQYLPSALYRIADGILRWVVVVLVALMALQQAGVSVQHLWAAVSAFFVLIAVGFVAVWSVLSNILCAVFLIIFAPFRIGDEIELIEPTGSGSGLKGRVTGLNILFTTLEQISSETGETFVIEVPNNIFFQKSIRRVVRSKQTTEPLKLSENGK